MSHVLHDGPTDQANFKAITPGYHFPGAREVTDFHGLGISSGRFAPSYQMLTPVETIRLLARDIRDG